MSLVAIYCDLHLKFEAWTPPILDVDLVILAGDIHTGVQGIAWAERAFTAPVVYVPGNREFYGHDIDDLPAAVRRAARDGHVHLLDGARAEIAGLTVAGVTLWTDYDDRRPEIMDFARRAMADYVLIANGRAGRRAAPADFLARHVAARAWLRALPPTDIVVTHHAPSYRSVAARFEGHPLNGAFASRLDGLVEELSPRLWVHGHMQIACDYRFGATRVICNPRGYPGEWGDFDAALVIDIEVEAGPAVEARFGRR